MVLRVPRPSLLGVGSEPVAQGARRGLAGPWGIRHRVFSASRVSIRYCEESAEYLASTPEVSF